VTTFFPLTYPTSDKYSPNTITFGLRFLTKGSVGKCDDTLGALHGGIHNYGFLILEDFN
jgi:hypothetical protein